MQTNICPKAPLSDVLHIPRGITALVGGGGKTTLMFHLARELAHDHKVIVATTTHVMRPEEMPVLTDPTTDEIVRALETDNAIFVGRVASHDKMTASGIDAAQLATLADYVLIEADGAKGRPVKAPAFYEPVIPAGTALVIAVAGLDGIGRTIEDIAHRPALLADLLGVQQSHVLTPADLARVLVSAQGQRRYVEPSMRYSIVLNKADDDARLALGQDCAARIDPALCGQVLILSLDKEAVPC